MNKEKLLFYIHNLYPLDYLFFFGVFMLFIIIVGVVLWIRVNTVYSLLLLFFSLIMIIPIGVVGYVALDKNIRPREVEIIKNQKLLYSNNVVLRFTITPSYKVCMVDVKLVKKSSDLIQRFKNSLHPIYQTSFKIYNQTYIERILPNIKAKDYDLLLKTYCF